MKNLLRKIYPQRKPWTHKGEHGYVLIVAGSKRYSGSPVFNAMSALRAGVDLITIIGPKRAMDIAATFAPDIIAYPLEGDWLEEKHILEILEIGKNFNSLIIGGGLGRNGKTLEVIRQIIKKINLPMVIDADAIYALVGQRDILKNKKVVITPHIREFEILTGEKVLPDTSEIGYFRSQIDADMKGADQRRYPRQSACYPRQSAILKDRQEKTKKWAKKLAVTILLKGYIDVISDGQKIFLNKTGSPFMTKGGFGDTLAGICGAILARGISPFESACAAAYINGKAGELAAQKYGEGVLASDIFDGIHKVIKEI